MSRSKKYIGLTPKGMFYAKLHFDYHIPSFLAVWIIGVIDFFDY